MDMKTSQLLGLIALVVGVAFIALAYHASNSMLDQLSDKFTGRYPDQTVWYFMAGIAGAGIGAYMLLVGRRN
jgi:hypothetical protein